MYDILWSRWDGKIGTWDFSGRGLGGWSLNVQHFYNPTEKTIYLGTGERSAATAFGSVVTIFLDQFTFEQKYGFRNWEASRASFQQIAVAPDGTLYIADAGVHRVYRYNPVNDTLTIAAGATWCVPYNCPSSNSYGGDGGPATLARLYEPSGIAFGPDGSYYIADMGNSRVRRVGTDGIITTVAGNGDYGYSGDGGPALNASLSFPQNLAIGLDGTIHILDGNNTIRRVSPDGTITTEAYFPDYILHLALGPDGSLYYSVSAQFESRVFRLWPDGKTTVVAGNGTQGSDGDGGPATDAQIDWPMGLAVGPDNSLFIAEYHGRRVRRVGSDGVIMTVAGGGPCCAQGGLGGPATAASLYELYHLTLGHDGSFYVGSFYSSPIYWVGPQGPSYLIDDIKIPSRDARQVYVFNSSGRHLRTIDALT
jgi:hypothetical protein